jgi:hypothetical protein
MKGLQAKKDFTAFLSKQDRELAERLAEIEEEDSERCAHCGGEDCICCEYYHDRQKWKTPEEFFGGF